MTKGLEERMEDFGEEMEDFGDRLGEEMERVGKELERSYHSVFGAFGPFLWSLVGLVLLGILVWGLHWIGECIPSAVFIITGDFILEHLALLFLLLLIFNYSSYFSKRFPGRFKYLSPLTSALSIIVWIWIVGGIVLLMEPQFDIISFAIRSLLENLTTIFVLLAILFYLLLMIKESKKSQKGTYMTSDWEKKSDSKRLYRSGKDKLLGGVCGGIGEYFEIDPVIVRLIWVILAIASLGTALLVYIILWILIPRNLRHHW